MLLALLGVAPILQDQDPFVGFSGAVTLFEESPNSENRNAGPLMVTRRSKLVWFNHQSFPKRKVAGTKRIFCLGGSTTHGRPYSDSTSFCGWLREFLPLASPDTHWEVVNAGGVSYASYRVAALMDELVQYEPDLFIVYSAQNEFLEDRTYADFKAKSQAWQSIESAANGLRTYAVLRRLIAPQQANVQAPAELAREVLPAEVDERLNKTIGPADYQRDDAWSNKVVAHYRWNLNRMIRLADRAGAKVLFVVPAENELDFSPFKSEPGSTEAATSKRVDELVAASAKVSSSDPRAALELVLEATQLDPRNASALYRAGNLCFRSEDYEQAATLLRAAIDEDVCPLRATSAIKNALREVIVENNVAFVDFESLLRDLCIEQHGHSLLGDDYFLDHVHPTIESHRQLALAICAHPLLRSMQGTQTELGAGFEQLVQKRTSEVLDSIDQVAEGTSLRNLAKVLHWSGKFSEAANRASDALEVLGNDAESRFVLADCLKNLGQSQRALSQYELLAEDYPSYSRAFVPYGELLSQFNKDELAFNYLDAAITLQPGDAYTNLAMGRWFMKSQEWESALAPLRKADSLYGGDDQVAQMIELCVERLTED